MPYHFFSKPADAQTEFHYDCWSVLGLVTNIKHFKYTFQCFMVCRILNQHGAAILRKHEDKFSPKENCKVMNNYKNLAISKSIVLIH